MAQLIKALELPLCIFRIALRSKIIISVSVLKAQKVKPLKYSLTARYKKSFRRRRKLELKHICDII